MAEMTTLIAALYREYQTSIAPGFENTTPGITARVEVFYDDRFPKLQVNSSVFASQLILIHLARRILA
jgi:hypothetical protein